MKDEEKNKHEHPYEHEHGHRHEHAHDRTHGHGHDHDHALKSRFHDPEHAAEYDKRAAMEGIRGALTTKLIEMMDLKGTELVLDLATGTGRVARPVSKQLQSGADHRR